MWILFVVWISGDFHHTEEYKYKSEATCVEAKKVIDEKAQERLVPRARPKAVCFKDE